jgi:hypothetical protein
MPPSLRHLGVLALAVQQLIAQQPPSNSPATPAPAEANPPPSSTNLPSIPQPNTAAAPSELAGTGPASEKARQEFETLLKKANDGDALAALDLADRVLASGNPDMASSLYLKAAEANHVIAQEKLALLLLSSDNPALWPSGHSWLDKAIQGGSVIAMEKQALIMLNGTNGRERSIEEAVRLLNRARQLPGAKETYFVLGNLAAQGIGMPQDGAIALANFQEGAQRGSIPCLIALHKLYREGTIIPKDSGKAEQLGKQASDLMDAEAAYQMAIYFESFKDPASPDWKEASRWLKLASERGAGGASTRLATYELNGKLGKPNIPEAIRLYRLGAEQGDAEACFQLSSLYRDGSALPKDAVASAGWCRLAAERGLGVAQNEYGIMLVGGVGLTRNPVEAAQWFQKAAQQRIPAAIFNLAALLENGVGMAANGLEALRLYEAAARENHPGAQNRLAVLLQSGAITGAPDPVGAAYWAERRAKNDPTGGELAKQLRSALTPDQQGELQRRLEAAGIGSGGS